MNHETAQYKGAETVIYTNNSPETLNKVFSPLLQRISTRE